MANPMLAGDVNRLTTNPGVAGTDLIPIVDVSGQVLTKATVTDIVGAVEVAGPASSTDNAIARFDSTTGKIIQNSATTVSDTTGTINFTAAAGGITLKQGANGRVGTFVANGATPVSVSNSSIAVTDAIVISLGVVGGTVGAVPAIQTITGSTGFTVAGTASDTSTYNYAIIKNAA